MDSSIITKSFALAAILAVNLAASKGAAEPLGPGQSDWTSAGQACDYGAASTASLCQSGWSTPTQAQTAVAPAQAQLAPGSLGQSDWSDANFTDKTPAGASFMQQSPWLEPQQAPASGGALDQMSSGTVGQMGWGTAPLVDQSELSCAATQVPMRASERMSFDFEGSVSQTDMGGAWSGAGGGNISTGAGLGGCSPLAGSIVPSMDEVIGSAMAVPMMMAASSGLIGQRFGGYAPGAGFRGYGPGAVGTGLAGYFIGRAANRAANHALRGIRW